MRSSFPPPKQPSRRAADLQPAAESAAIPVASGRAVQQLEPGEGPAGGQEVSRRPSGARQPAPTGASLLDSVEPGLPPAQALRLRAADHKKASTAPDQPPSKQGATAEEGSIQSRRADAKGDTGAARPTDGMARSPWSENQPIDPGADVLFSHAYLAQLFVETGIQGAQKHEVETSMLVKPLRNSETSWGIQRRVDQVFEEVIPGSIFRHSGVVLPHRCEPYVRKLHQAEPKYQARTLDKVTELLSRSPHGLDAGQIQQLVGEAIAATKAGRIPKEDAHVRGSELIRQARERGEIVRSLLAQGHFKTALKAIDKDFVSVGEMEELVRSATDKFKGYAAATPLGPGD